MARRANPSIAPTSRRPRMHIFGIHNPALQRLHPLLNYLLNPLRMRFIRWQRAHIIAPIRRAVKTRDQVSRHPWPRPVRTPRIFRRQAPPRPILHLVIDPGGNGYFVSTVLHISPRLITLSIINEIRYHQVMIQSFKCPDTQSLFQRKRTARFVNIERVALRKLAQLEWASRIDDLRIPPNNRLELLKGNRVGQYSIRINAQWRVCFRWKMEMPSTLRSLITIEGARYAQIKTCSSG